MMSDKAIKIMRFDKGLDKNILKWLTNIEEQNKFQLHTRSIALSDGKPVGIEILGIDNIEVIKDGDPDGKGSLENLGQIAVKYVLFIKQVSKVRYDELTSKFIETFDELQGRKLQ